MNLILILKELWRRRVLVALSIFLAAAFSVLAVFQVSLLPPSIAKREKIEGQGSIEILVDSANSPIAESQRSVTGLIARAGVFARLIAGGNVVGQIARTIHIPVKQIDVSGPVPFPGEVPGTEQASLQLHPYGISVTQAEALPVVKVVTRAPTAGEAGALAAAVPAAIRHVVKSVQEQQGTPPAKRVELRVLGPAERGVTDDSKGKKIALAIFLVLLALFVTLILGVPRLIAAWRTVDPDAGPAGRRDELERSLPALLPLPPNREDGVGEEEHEATRIGQREP